jgi:hypothetical protein
LTQRISAITDVGSKGQPSGLGDSLAGQVAGGGYRRRRSNRPQHPQEALAVVIPGYTGGVKTAISLPDDTYEQATRQAAELGISRSEFFARAARSYLDQLAAQSLTQQINEALQNAGDDSNAAAAAAGRRYLAGQDDW